MATITGRNVVVDLRRARPAQPGDRARRCPRLQAFQQFLAALRMQGFTVVEAAWAVSRCPRPTPSCRRQRDRHPAGGSAGPAGGQIVTQIFKAQLRKRQQPGTDAAPADQPEQHHQRQPGTNALVITDYADNLQRLAIIAAMDVSNATDVEVIS